MHAKKTVTYISDYAHHINIKLDPILACASGMGYHIYAKKSDSSTINCEEDMAVTR